MNRGKARLQASLAVGRMDAMREEAQHIERNLPKWHFDRVAKEKLKRIAETIRAAVAAYDDFREYMEKRSEHQKEDT